MNSKFYNLDLVPDIFFDLIARIFPSILLILFVLLDNKNPVIKHSKSILGIFLPLFLVVLIYFVGIILDTLVSFIDHYFFDTIIPIYKLISGAEDKIKKLCNANQDPNRVQGTNKIEHFVQIWDVISNLRNSSEETIDSKNILIKLVAEVCFFRNVTFGWLILILFHMGSFYKSRLDFSFSKNIPIFNQDISVNECSSLLIVFLFLFFIYYLRRKIAISYAQDINK